jgi:ClpP class serine protease
VKRYRLTGQLVAKYRADQPVLVDVSGSWATRTGPEARRFASASRGVLAEADWDATPPGGAEMPRAPEEPGVEIVAIMGPVATRAGIDDACTWVDGYDAIEERLRCALECADGVLLVIDSPGGDAPGCFEAVRRMRAMVDERACSAAYALALVADEIHAPDVTTSRVGSIGCLSVHAEVSKMLEAEGVAVSVFRSGARKAEGLEVEALRPETAARIQAGVNECAAEFAALVAERRGMDPQALTDLEGASFTSRRALGLGLIDGLATREEATDMAIERATKAATGTPAAAPAAQAVQASNVALEAMGLRMATVLGTTDPDVAETLVDSLREEAKAGKAAVLAQKKQAEQLEAAERKSLLDRGEREGRLTPARRALLERKSVETLRELIVGVEADSERGIEAVEPLLPKLAASSVPRQPAEASPGDPAASRGGLTSEESEAHRLIGGVSEKELLAARAQLAKQSARAASAGEVS